jgi:hydroxyacylglutathione hydrolase
MNLAVFTFNDFYENTYLLYDSTGECVIIDPGCNTASEESRLSEFIKGNQLKPVALLNTHCHIDHVLGNAYVAEKYKLDLWAHKGELPVLESCEMVANMYGIRYTKSPAINKYLDHGDEVKFGNTVLKVIYTPGHSPASISFYNEEHKILIAGDVLFHSSIGRTDLPGGDYDTLIHSIKSQYYPLGDEVDVYPGHGEKTTIAYERRNNPFLK